DSLPGETLPKRADNAIDLGGRRAVGLHRGAGPFELEREAQCLAAVGFLRTTSGPGPIGSLEPRHPKHRAGAAIDGCHVANCNKAKTFVDVLGVRFPSETRFP